MPNYLLSLVQTFAESDLRGPNKAAKGYFDSFVLRSFTLKNQCFWFKKRGSVLINNIINNQEYRPRAHDFRVN